MRNTLLIFFCLTALLLTACASGPELKEARSAGTVLDDEVIETRARDKLYGDPELVKTIHVNVTSYDRVVLLTGEALSEVLRDKAVDIVRNLDKVRRVHNEIRVKDLTPFKSRANDSWISTKIKTKMLTTEGFDSSGIKVVTEEGVVFLMGKVSRATGHQAAEIARRVEGVARVVLLFEYRD